MYMWNTAQGHRKQRSEKDENLQCGIFSGRKNGPQNRMLSSGGASTWYLDGLKAISDDQVPCYTALAYFKPSNKAFASRRELTFFEGKTQKKTRRNIRSDRTDTIRRLFSMSVTISCLPFNTINQSMVWATQRVETSERKAINGQVRVPSKSDVLVLVRHHINVVCLDALK